MTRRSATTARRLVLLSICLAAACGSGTSTGPTPASASATSVDGIWSDTGGFYRWDLRQTNASVSGTEASTVAGSTDGGVITGTVSGSVFTIDSTIWRSRFDGESLFDLRYRVQGQLTVDRGTMTGTLTYTPLWEARVIDQDVHMFRLIAGH